MDLPDGIKGRSYLLSGEELIANKAIVVPEDEKIFCEKVQERLKEAFYQRMYLNSCRTKVIC